MPPESDANDDGGTTTENETDTGKKPEGDSKGEGDDGKTVPLSALTAMRKRAQDAEKANSDATEAKRVADEAAATKRGEFEELYGAAKPKAERFDKHVAQVGERNTGRVAALPEEWRDAVPSQLDALDLSLWLDTIEPKLRKVSAKGGEMPAGARSGAGGGADDAPPMPAQAKVDAANAGMSEEAWWAVMKNAQRYKKPAA